MERPCEIPNCPALALRHQKTCKQHENARTAKDLHLAKDASGGGAKRCLGCCRAFVESDYVIATAERRVKLKKGGNQFGYRHVACEPPTPKLSKKAIKESVKPLLEALV